MKKIGTVALAAVTAVFLAFPTMMASADAIPGETVVTLGKDLKDSERSALLQEMQVDPNGNNVQILDVTNEEEYQYLGKYMSRNEIGTRAISSAKIVLTGDGKGMDVKTKNITAITPSMYANAAITAGIKDADIYVTAPFNVSGTAALTGIIKAFEEATGKKIDENQKQVANEEIVRTNEVAKEINDPDKAAQFMNELKKEIATERPSTPEEYRDIVINISQEFNINLSDQSINQLVQFSQNFNSLNLDWDQLSDQLSKLKGDLANVLNSEQTQGIIDSILEWLGELFSAIGDFFSSSSSKATEK
ncbi:DUF1002 domain-containing protein [Hazenella coriacea]|nr:DUF1002 domain-containing protein [Hazenella coriacea]